jgi:hypothetical protein
MEPGTTLLGNVNSGVIVSGHLEAQGTSINPITLTTGVTEAWAGVDLRGGSANFNHVALSQAGANGQSALQVNGQMALSNTTIRDNSGNGLDVSGGQVTAVCSTFTQNQNDGIYIVSGGNPNVTVLGSSISGNGEAGVRNDSLSLVDARYNWWGDATGPGGIGPGTGDAVSGTVDYEPWLTKPTCVRQIPELLTDADVLTVTEGVETVVLTFTLNVTPAITATVNYETVAGTAVPPGDYVPISGTLTFTPGNRMQTVTIQIVDDNLVEEDESLDFVLSSPTNMILDNKDTQLVIQDDDEAVEETIVIYLPLLVSP